MGKLLLRNCKRAMSVSFVEEAAEKAKYLVHREWRGPGDINNAMRRVEQRYGVEYRALWSLRYRKPKDILMSVYVRITEAYDAEIGRQRRLLDHEFATARKAGVAEGFIGAARSLGRPEDEGEVK